MTDLIQNLKGLGRTRLLVMAAVALGVMTALLVGLSVALAPQYRPLAMDVNAADASRMISELETAGFAPKVSADGTVISLPEADIARARMALASAGLPAEGNTGWEIFDTASGIGMNSFLQRVNRLRALEGELARSIETIDKVEQARVHLVLPERETFSQERPDPSASVVVHARRGQSVTRRQALAIRSLVAAAVPGLAPDRVTILSGTGEAILTEEDAIAGSGIAGARAEIEERLRRNVENILGAHVGAENVRVRVAVDLDTSREVVVQQSYDPDQQVARSTSSSTESSAGTEAGNANVDVANNLPGFDTGGASGSRSDNRDVSSDDVVYEIGNTRSERITEAGGVRRITVAALVNGSWDADGTYVPRSDQDIARLTALVRSAAGIDEDRGDIVTVDNLQFVTGPPRTAEVGGLGLGDMLARNFGSLLRVLGGIVIVALVILLAVRPALRNLAAAPALDKPAANPALSEPPGTAVGAPSGETGELLDPEDPHEDPLADVDYVSIASVSGHVMSRYIEELGQLAHKEPEATMRTIRNWINQKA
ncbi:flagellar basal-body MS-ring/collar protein FliF [Sulfitobacter aestuarii]|uniref:Flagellar M-ring protein n=1 Tax=Sulfitobacter aestuarii TaxID=2161676 RepID=A0ABW5U185_9RHOB